MDDIGKKIFQRRKELGLTLEEVGSKVGVGKSTVRKWENGLIKNMGRDKIALLADALQMSPVEFVPCENTSTDTHLDSNERRFLSAYRGATEAARQIALEILENHQKEESPSRVG